MAYKNPEDKKRYMKDYQKKNKKQIKEYKKQYYEKNKDKILKEMKEYSQKPEVKKRRRLYINDYNSKNTDKRRIWWKNYEKNHKKEISKGKKKYRKINFIRLNQYQKEYRKNNKEKINKYQRKHKRYRRKTDKNYNIQCRLRRLFFQALKKYTKTGKYQISKKYGIYYKAIIEYLKPFPEDLSKYHIDHIRPLCSFNFINEDGSQNLEEIRKAFAPENHQWLTAHENLSKRGRY